MSAVIPNDRGSWQPSTAYAIGDCYTAGQSYCYVTAPYTSGTAYGATDTANNRALLTLPSIPGRLGIVTAPSNITLTANVSTAAAVPGWTTLSVTVPSGANLELVLNYQLGISSVSATGSVFVGLTVVEMTSGSAALDGVFLSGYAVSGVGSSSGASKRLAVPAGSGTRTFSLLYTTGPNNGGILFGSSSGYQTSLEAFLV